MELTTPREPSRANQPSNPPPPLLEIGQLVGTRGFVSLFNCEIYAQTVVNSVMDRYLMGDWGVLDAEDRAHNDSALDPAMPGRIFAKYDVRLQTGQSEPIYVVTEADRSVTTLLLPSEY